MCGRSEVRSGSAGVAFAMFSGGVPGSLHRNRRLLLRDMDVGRRFVSRSRRVLADVRLRCRPWLDLFAIEAFCIAPVYFALRKLAPGGEWAGMLAWLLVFYAFSLNAMRQSVAIGLVLCSVVCIVQRNPARFLLCVIGACLFHQTAVIAVVLYPLARAVGWGRRAMFGKWQTVVLAVLILFAFGFIVAFGDRLVVLASMLKDSYSYQVNHIGSGDIGFSYLYVTICCLGIYLISRDDFGSSDTTEGEGKSLFDRMRVFKACSAIACVGGLMWQLNYVADTLGRLGAYGMVLLCVMAALLAANGRRSRGHLAVALSLFAVYFVAAVMVLGMEEVYPYASAILGLG